MHLCITHEKIVHFKVIKSIENVKYLRNGSTVSSDKVKPEKHQKHPRCISIVGEIDLKR